ncbi:MAG TPA: hypothetical protein DEH11_13385 [Actinobacteria bacterium]|nr:hypothetical protein [Actinomycetota bacterium]
MHAAAREALTAELVIRTGGWHPRYARAVLIEQSGDRALVLVDGNGDGAELELEYWGYDARDGWQGGSSSGNGSLAELASVQSWDAGEFVCAVGRAEPGAVVSISYGGSGYEREASELGVWGFLHDADSPRPSELPAVTAVTGRPH